jgi:hypothetical protein
VAWTPHFVERHAGDPLKNVQLTFGDRTARGEAMLTDDIVDDALNAMRFLPDVVTSAIETTLARVYDVDADELAALLYPES